MGLFVLETYGFLSSEYYINGKICFKIKTFIIGNSTLLCIYSNVTQKIVSSLNIFFFVGWDKQSYGYHGDDGHSFCSSGTGQPYGPTFTTGDVIGCGVNLIDNTCFYTKNGHHLGTAFTDLPVSVLFE